LTAQPVIAVNKGASAGAEGFLELRKSAGDPHTIMIAGSNLFTTPYATRVPFSWKDLTPVALLALDEFVLWVPSDAPFKTARAFLDAVRAGGSGTFRMGGTGSKSEDHVLTAALERLTASKRFTYVPFAGGGAVAVQLAGKHIDASVNNPIEAVSQWKAGAVRPLCIFSARRSVHGFWSSIPTCREAGVNVEYQAQLGVFMPPGVKSEHVAFYVDLLRRTRSTADWRDFSAAAARDQAFVTGSEFRTWLDASDRLHYELMQGAGLLAPN
jgi:tripartite-type tricarboxylate transporter receptor subunit TctC